MADRADTVTVSRWTGEDGQLRWQSFLNGMAIQREHAGETAERDVSEYARSVYHSLGDRRPRRLVLWNGDTNTQTVLDGTPLPAA